MATWLWILLVVVVVAVVVVVVGLVLGRRRRISLTQAPPRPTTPVEGPPAKGGYRAGGSISFSSGSGTALAPKPRTPEPVRPAAVPVERLLEHPVADRPEVDGQPGVGDDASEPRDSVRPGVVEVELPEPEPEPVAVSERPATSEDQAEPESAAQPDDSPPTGTAAPAPAEAEPVVAVPTAAPAPPIPTPSLVADEPAGAVGAADEETIAPTEGRLYRLRGRLSRSQNTFGRSLLGLLGAGTLDEESWTEVEDTLLMADLGSAAALEITDRLRAEVAAHGVADAAGARALLKRVLVDAVQYDAQGNLPDRSIRALPHDGRPSVLLVVGVNGTGKTTTTGKLARVLVADGRTVVLGAADTFRAAAADQLQTWAERVGAEVVRGAAGSDPAAVAFDAVRRGIADQVDAVLVDTAGRLHTKAGLMDELGKVKRVIEKQAEVDEILLVLDATTGQNGLVQAKVFAEVVSITGIVLTKLDGTAKGGIVVAVQRGLGVPVKLVGLGEGPDDLAPFEPEAFVNALLGD